MRIVIFLLVFFPPPRCLRDKEITGSEANCEGSAIENLGKPVMGDSDPQVFACQAAGSRRGTDRIFSGYPHLFASFSILPWKMATSACGGRGGTTDQWF